VSEVTQRGAVARSPEVGDQVGALVDGGQQLDLESRLLQVRREIFGRRSLVPGWVDRVETDQPLQDLGRLWL